VSYLLYCVLNGLRGPARRWVKGVGGHAVWIMQCEGLCAAVSEDALVLQPAPALQEMVAYAKAIEAFNRHETVIPMRYGCRFAGAAQVRHWMRKCAADMRGLLLGLDGCVEMGVRALPLQPDRAALSLRGAVPAGGSGADYLKARRRELALRQSCEGIVQMICDALAGQFRQCTSQIEARGQRSSMVSVYFLVERARIAAFRDKVAELTGAGAALMVSGPWPPYNFVCNLTGGREDLAPASRLCS
jgi:gas vesicle protein GvpL/GvpF